MTPVFNKSQSLRLAAALMALSILLSRFMGLIRDKVISYYYGASLESDIYFVSFVVPDFINYLLAGGYFSITLIPLLSDYFERDENDAWRFFSTVLTWCGLLITFLTACAMVLAPQLAHLIAPGFTEEATLRLAYFLRIILPAQICFLLGSCFTALLYLRKQFLVPALMPLIYNGCIIIGGLLMISKGMEGFCWGVLIGSFLGNFLLPMVAAIKGAKGFNFRLVFRHPGLKLFILLALPLMIGQSVVVLDEQFLRFFGSMTTEGAVSWLNYARRIMLVPVGVVAQAAGVASYPFLARLVAQGKETEFNDTLQSALCATVAFLLPLSIWMIAAADPIIQFIFEQGRFSALATEQTAICLQIMLLGVFCWGIQQIVGRAYYARKDTLTPALIGTGATLLTLPVYYTLTHLWGAFGIAGASAFSVVFYTLTLSWFWWRKWGSGGFTGLGRTLVAATTVSVIAVIPSWYVMQYAKHLPVQHPLLGALFAICCGFLCFALIFQLAGRLLARRTLAPVLDALGPIKQRLKSKFGLSQHD